MRKHALRIAISLGIVAIFLLYRLDTIQLPLVHQVELWSYDWRLKTTLPGGQDTQVVIVDIDEKALSEIGRWPWSRNVVARMLDKLIDTYGAAVVGFDVVFAEPDTSSGIRELDSLAKKELKNCTEYQKALSRNRSRFDYDSLLASRIKGRAVVLGYYFNGDEDKQGKRSSGMLPESSLVSEELKRRSSILKKTGFGANLPVLQKASAGAGHFNPEPDQDGVTRRVPMLIEYNGSYYESLSLAIFRTLFGQPEIKPVYNQKDGLLGWLEIADLKLPVDLNGAALIPYRGRQGSFPYVSAADILKGRAAKELLEGTIVLVGTTAPGLMDLRSTPVSPVYPGVEIHANMLAGFLNKTLRHAPAFANTYEFILILGLGLLLAFLLPRLGPLASLVSTLVILAAVSTVNLVAWHKLLVLPFAASALMILLLYILNATWGFLEEARIKHQITGLFGQYVPPQIVLTMSKDPRHFTMAAEDREMTVLFADIVGFTSISEKLEPLELAQVMNDYLSAMTSIIYRHGGTIDKYIGDAIMAFWGAPLVDTDHASHAVQAALEMQQRMVQLRQEFAAQGLPELQIGIGINSGQMRVGNMGSSYRVAYTVMGDAVNLASRLEGLTRQYGVWVIAGEATRQRVSTGEWLELDLVRVKGKHEPVAIFEPLDSTVLNDEARQQELQLHTEFIDRYRARDWDGAEALLNKLQPHFSEGALYQLYRERITLCRQEPPNDSWDGICTFTTK